jgi:Subtilase family/Domain of unknown function DUF11/Fibronectin type III domain/WD40-like Beta Propeller Repeat
VGALAATLTVAGASSHAHAESMAAGWLPGGAPLAHANLHGLDTQLSEVARTAQRKGGPAGLAAAAANSLDVTHNKVRVIVVPSARTAAASSAVTSSGGTVEASADGLVEALVPPAALPHLADAAAVAVVRAPAVPYPDAVNEGVAATDASAWQAEGFDGSGVKIAIIDLGFVGYQSLLGTALPSSVVTDNRCGGATTSSSVAVVTNHGTAVAELVHQMAPGAQLYLICIDNEVDLALAEQDAIADGVQIVNHSISWFNTSRGDGTGAPGSPDATVVDARAHGILWVNAAGNYATQHWSGNYAPDAVAPDETDFTPGNTLNQVTIQSGEQACAYLKWDDWPVTSEDFDLYLVQMSDDQIVDSSLGDQSDGPAAPIEGLCYTNTGPTKAFGIGIVRYSASTSPRLDLFYTGSSDLQYQTAGGSLSEPASSPDALAVGADCWQTGALEAYSSQGPTIDGRTKPDLVAPDGVSTQTYGGAGATCGQTGFLGTSASSPQVAGAAAVLLGRYPTLSPAGLEADLEQTSISNDSPPSVPNDVRGHGLTRLGTVEPLSGTLIFSDPGTGIYTVDADGSNLEHLSLPGAGSIDLYEGSLDWSPDGSKFTFAAEKTPNTHSSVWTANAHGSSLTEVADDGSDPSWSPDGTKLVYGTALSGLLTVSNADGSNPNSIGNAGVDNTSPAWSPDGTKIAWISGSGLVHDVWVMNADGTAKTRLTTSGDVYTAGIGAHVLAWSPDGTTLVFIRGDNADTQIWMMNANSANEHLVYAQPHLTGPVESIGWSPDGTRILYDLAFGEEALWTVAPDGSGPTLLVPSTGGGMLGPGWKSGPVPEPHSTPVSPVLGGVNAVGQTLSVDSGKWAPAAGESFGFAWSRCDSSGLSCAPVAGATDSTHLEGSADLGSRLEVTVTVSNGNGSAGWSAMSGVVPAAAPVAQTLPVISGAATVGNTLTLSSAGGWNGSPTFSYRWRRCDSTGGTCSDIPGATQTSYTLVSADVGSMIRVAVFGTNAGGSNVSTSSASELVTGPPGAPTGVAAAAGYGQATVSFTAPASNGGAPISSYTVTSSPGGVTAVGGASPITVNGLTNGTTYTFTVKASNSAGTGAASLPSNAVTPTAPVGGGGGGGGGSGGGGPGPDDVVTVGASPIPRAVGDSFVYTVTVTNQGTNSDGTTLTINLPAGVSYQGSKVDRGPGCTISGQTLACFLDFFPAGAGSTVLVFAQVTSLANLVLTTSVSSSPGEISATDGAVMFTLNLASSGGPPSGSFAPVPPPGTTPSKTSTAAALSLSGLKTVLLHAKKPSLEFTARVSKTMTLTLTLLDSTGRQLARWTRYARAGSNSFTLLLPSKAKHAGHDVLKVSATGTTARSFTITLKA